MALGEVAAICRDNVPALNSFEKCSADQTLTIFDHL
jgi:hypothetical protein